MDTKSFLKKAVMMYPDDVSIVFEGTRLTNRELLEKVFRMANALLRLGLKKGDRVAVLLNNCNQSVECFYGVTCAGLVLLPLNARNSAEEHLYILNDSGASAVLLGSEFIETIVPILPDASGVLHSACVNGDAPEPMISYDELIDGVSSEDPGIEINDGDIASHRYTAGTTGKPKGVIHDHKSSRILLYNTLMDGFVIEKDDAICLTGPVTHASGSMILPHIVRGAKVIIMSGFDPAALLQTIEKECVTTLYMVPTMIVMLLAHPDLEKYDVSSLKTIRYGASPISPEILKRAIKAFGDVFIQGYGSSEAGMPLTLLSKEDHILDGSEKKLKRLSSVGREVTVATVRIMDEDDNILPPGEIGEIVIQSEQSMIEYWKNEEATARTLKNGWLHSRDMGYKDEDGYVFLVDRKDDMIISGGFNVYPREVEDVLYAHESVLEAAVFGVPDKKWGESVKAVVSFKQGMSATEEELIEHCKEHLASYKKPSSVDFISELPKNLFGKILRRTLREPHWEGVERKIH